EGAVPELQAQFPALEHLPILVPEDREQELGEQLRLDRRPFDVEELRGRRTGAVLENVAPPGVAAGPDPHVIGDEVDNVSEPVTRDRLGELPVRRVTAELRIDLVVIADV